MQHESDYHEIQALYDALSDDYDLCCEDWDADIASDGEVLARALTGALGYAPTTVLDCSCGIGTQAIGLAMRGITVTGSDLSPRAIARAEIESRRRNVTVSYIVSPFANLESRVIGSFDALVSCDNALPHLMSDDAVIEALRAMLSKLTIGGVLLVSIRDYDDILRKRPETSEVDFFRDPNGQTRVSFQRWYWSDDGRSYEYEMFLIRHDSCRTLLKRYTGRYRPITRQHLSDLLSQVGFEVIGWRMPDKSGYFQPFVIARKPLRGE